MSTLLRVTGFGALISFYRYIFINQPKLTTLVGVVLILGVGAVHAVEAPRHFQAATYLGGLFVLQTVSTLVAAFGILRGAKSWGWTLGAVISGLTAVVYLVSRIVGLPGYVELAGQWDEPWGSMAVILEGLFLAGWFSVITGLAIVYPDERDWYD